MSLPTLGPRASRPHYRYRRFGQRRRGDARGPQGTEGLVASLKLADAAAARFQRWPELLPRPASHGTFRSQTHYVSCERHTSCGDLWR